MVNHGQSKGAGPSRPGSFIRATIAGLLASILASAIAAPAQAAVEASIDKNPVLQGEALSLRLRITDGNAADPDLAPLRQDFQILSQSQSSQHQFVNGQRSSHRDWLIQLVPKGLGTLTIPALTVGKERSQALRVEVRAPDPQTGEQREVFIEFEAARNQVHLREQLLLTTRLYVAGELTSGNLSEPRAEGAVVESLGEQSDAQELIGATRYRVIERRYALFPEKSGRLEIEAPVFSGEIADRSQRQTLFGFGTPSRSVYAAGKSLGVLVEPPPAQAQGSFWLPASQVVISESLSPADGPWRVGEALTRTITLRFYGQLHTQLPELPSLAPDGVQSFAETPQDKTSSTPRGVVAERVYRRAIIPAQAGEMTLPALELPWWNVDQDATQIARLPARRLTIAAVPAPPGTAAPIANSPPAATALPTVTESISKPTSSWWPILTLVCAAGWLGTLLMWLWSQRSEPPPRAAAPDRRELLRCLREADAGRCRQALLQWAGEEIGPLRSLGQLATQAAEPTASQALRDLDASLYGSGGGFDRNALIEFVRHYRPAPPGRHRGDELAPLYPD